MIDAPSDGDAYPDPEVFYCSCGEGPYQLWWNGGELDSVHCTCGLWYYGEHRRTVVRVDNEGPYAADKLK